MDAITAVALGLQAVSLTALGLTLRQVRLSSAANHLPVVLDAFLHSRSAAWVEGEAYVRTRLVSENPTEMCCCWLPLPARTHVFTVGSFYDDLGKLVAHGMIDQKLVIGSYGTPLVRVWDAVSRYVYAERRAHQLDFWVYFEDLAVRTHETPQDCVYDELGMRRRPPRTEAGEVKQ